MEPERTEGERYERAAVPGSSTPVLLGRLPRDARRGITYLRYGDKEWFCASNKDTVQSVADRYGVDSADLLKRDYPCAASSAGVEEVESFANVPTHDTDRFQNPRASRATRNHKTHRQPGALRQGPEAHVQAPRQDGHRDPLGHAGAQVAAHTKQEDYRT